MFSPPPYLKFMACTTQKLGYKKNDRKQNMIKAFMSSFQLEKSNLQKNKQLVLPFSILGLIALIYVGDDIKCKSIELFQSFIYRGGMQTYMWSF